MPFIYDFLLDGQGDFILDEEGNKIIVGSNYVSGSDENRRLIAGRKPKAGYVRSFDIRNSGDDWAVTINKTEYVGRYPSRDLALSVVYGMATACSGRDASIDASFDDQLTRGISFIDSEGL